MIHRLASTVVVACSLAVVPAVAAQGHAAWPERTLVTIDVPFQTLHNDFAEFVSVTDAFVKTEKDTFTAAYAPPRGPSIDFGAAVRLAGSFGVGIAGSWFQRSGSATFNLSVPNPTVAGRPRELQGTAPDLNRREIALHLQALYAISLGRKGRLMLSAGPSSFNVRQDFVQGVEFDEAPGFSSVTLHQVLTTTLTRTIAGFNVGADVTWPIRSHLGVGTVARYSRATARFDPGSSTPMLTRSIEAQVGGLQIGAGLRVFF
jgi:hypothetical protein